MQPSETVCMWNYRFKNNSSLNSNQTTNRSDNSSTYLICASRLSCQNEMSPKAKFYCLQCHTLQCTLCESGLHKNKDYENHERLTTDPMNDEYCSVDRRHIAIFYCLTCQAAYCFHCYENQHQYSEARKHKLQKYRDGQALSMNKLEQQNRIESQPIKINSTNTVHVNRVPSSFEDIQVDGNSLSPPDRIQNSNKHVNQSYNEPQRDNFNEELLLESMIDDNDNNSSFISRKKAFLLINADEKLTINSDIEFLRRLKTEEDFNAKCLSIIGNTGDGKSYTLNQLFFNGNEIFQTSSTSDSCTMGVWTAIDEHSQTLLIDTEGRFGLSDDDYKRNRLLVKIFCISDIIIYRTRASKLPNDMFQFLSDASYSYINYYRKQFDNIKPDRSVSMTGPILIVFHETQHTGILNDDSQTEISPVEQLKQRFDAMNLSYDAYSSIKYIGIQTTGQQTTDFSQLKKIIFKLINNNNIRPRRPLSTIFDTLKTFNNKFNHIISPTFPLKSSDDLFSCTSKCLVCQNQCTMIANHEQDKLAHKCNTSCKYSKEYDNEVWKCLKCYDKNRDTIVYGKLITKNDGLVQGLIKYVWSGCVIECPHDGEIYRSRKHWYGNSDPSNVTRSELIHVWSNDDHSRLACDVTPRKFMELFAHASSYLSAPTKMIKEMIADQVAPSYWTPNKDATICSSCKLEFGSEYSKHHCRACGLVFCDTCTNYRRILPWINSIEALRVCHDCSINFIQHSPISSDIPTNSNHTNDDFTQLDIPTSRRFYEAVVNNFEKIAVEYPIKYFKETTRPTYWKPDNECHTCFICNQAFNSTTNRIHHCRSCGNGVCNVCSPNKRPVPARDWFEPVRICTLCERSIDESNSNI